MTARDLLANAPRSHKGPSCVNPEHLFAGTHADNMRDMVAKGRRAPSPNRWAKRRLDALRSAS